MSLNLLFRANTGLSSDAIELFGGGIYSHVDIVWPDGRLYGARSDVIGGVPSGVQFRPANYMVSPLVTPISIPCSPGEEAKGLAWALTQKGKPYDKLGIVAFGLGRNWRTEGAWWCSELVARMLEIAFNFECVISMNKVTPGGAAIMACSLAATRAPS
jgi:uncharacterized protein YycO